jgi:hypothetical protein
MDKHTNIRGEYIPIGNRLQYPRNWGKKKGATILLETRIADKIMVLEDTQAELSKLKACLDKVNEWDADTLN